MKAVLIELDYKGYYGRYALTPEEFKEEFACRLAEDMPFPGEGVKGAASYTFRPMVHAWYTIVEIPENDDSPDNLWNMFFTDMSWGLPDSDIESGNLAYIAEDEFQSLKGYLPAAALVGGAE